MLRALLLTVVLAPICAAAQPSRAEEFSGLPPGARIVLMPADIELYEVSGGGVLEPRGDWTSAAARHVQNALAKSKLGALVSEIPGEPDDALVKILHLHRAVSQAVVIHHYGYLKLPTKAGKLDWSLGPDASLLRSRSGADYALFTWIRDSYASPARKAAMVVAALVGMGVSGGAQVGYTSLVDLHSGRLVWFNRVSRLRGDLREEASAQETLDALLAEFPG